MTEANHEANREEFQRFWGEAIAELYAHLIVYANKLVKKVNVGEPADLVQACACRVIKYAKDPVTLTHNKKSYVYRSLHNIWVDEVKRSGVGMVQPLNSSATAKEMEALLPPVEPEVLATRKGEELRQEFEQLGPITDKEKELVALVTKHYTLEDIADLWGEHIDRVKTQWQRLIAKQRYRINKRNERAAAKNAEDEGSRKGAGPVR